MSEVTFTGTDFSVPITFIGMYSDGTPMVKTDQWDDIVKQADTMVLRPHNLNEFVAAMFLVDAANDAGGNIHRLILPYVPGARQDRSNPTGDVLFTARSVGNMINTRYFSKVVVLDPHSPVITNHIWESVEYPLDRVANKLWKGYGGIIAPDKGAKARAEAFGLAMSKEVTYGAKTRDVTTGRLSGFDITVEPGKHYLVVDDICDGGGTFLGLGEKIREQGAYADLFVTHGIFSKGTHALKEIYKNIYTTDSREIHERNDVIVMRVVKDMENYNG